MRDASSFFLSALASARAASLTTNGKPPNQQQDGARKQRNEEPLTKVVKKTVVVDETRNETEGHEKGCNPSYDEGIRIVEPISALDMSRRINSGIAQVQRLSAGRAGSKFQRHLLPAPGAIRRVRPETFRRDGSHRSYRVVSFSGPPLSQ